MDYSKTICGTVYVIHDMHVLLHLHKKYHTWFPLGGHTEANEFPYETAIREAKEEAGLDIKLLETYHLPNMDIGRVVNVPLPFCTYNENSGYDEDYYDFIFVGIPLSLDIKPNTGESQVLKWFSENEIRSSSDIKPHIKNTALAILDYIRNRKEE